MTIKNLLFKFALCAACGNALHIKAACEKDCGCPAKKDTQKTEVAKEEKKEEKVEEIKSAS